MNRIGRICKYFNIDKRNCVTVSQIIEYISNWILKKDVTN